MGNAAGLAEIQRLDRNSALSARNGAAPAKHRKPWDRRLPDRAADGDGRQSKNGRGHEPDAASFSSHGLVLSPVPLILQGESPCAPGIRAGPRYASPTQIDRDPVRLSVVGSGHHTFPMALRTHHRRSVVVAVGTALPGGPPHGSVPEGLPYLCLPGAAVRDG